MESFKLRTYASLILPILLEYKEGTGLKTHEIVQKAEERYSIAGLHKSLVHRTLRELENGDTVQSYGANWSLTDEGKEIVGDSTSTLSDYHAAMVEEFVGEVSQAVGGLNDYQSTYVETIFEDALFRILENIGDSAVAYLDATKLRKEEQLIEEIFDELAEARRKYDIGRKEKIDEVLAPALRACLEEGSDEFAQGLLNVSTRHVMWRILGVDPEMEKYQEDFFQDAPIYLDTNFLVSAICEHTVHHPETRWLVDAAKELEVPLRVFEQTVTEFENSVNYVDGLYRQSKGQTLDERLLNHEISQTFFRNEENYRDWSSFIATIKGELKAFLTENEMQIIDDDEMDLDAIEVTEAKSIIKNLQRRSGDLKHPELREHDARSLIAIQRERQSETDRPFNAPWFVTHHRKLRKPDELICDRLDYDLPCTISSDAFFELIYPFLWAEIDRGKASQAFRAMVKNNMMTIQSSSVENFITYVASEMDLATQEEEILVDAVQESHLRRTLEEDLEEGGLTVALATFQEEMEERLATEKDLRDEKERRQNLGEQLRELQAEGFAGVNLSLPLDDLQEQAESALDAETNKEKKDTLETLGSLIVEGMDGLELKGTNVRMAAEEIDLIAKNTNIRNWGDPVVVECKNWSKPVGAQEIAWFFDKLNTQQANTGILIAREGITGDEYKDAGQKVRDALRDGVRIVCLPLASILEAESIEEIEDTIEDLWYVPTDL